MNIPSVKPSASSSVIVHPTALVDASAQLGAGVEIGPYCIVGSGVVIGAGTNLQAHVVVGNDTVIGERNRVFPYASIGQASQDKKDREDDETRLEIGDENVLREFVTLNRGSSDGGITRIGHRNWIMAYCHVAHNCMLGDEIVMSNGTALAGYVRVENAAYLGGYTAIHQFCAIGELVMTGAHTMISQDVPPFVLAAGNRARLYGLNRVGLERANVPLAEVHQLQEAYKLFFRRKLTAEKSLPEIEAKLGSSDYVQRFVRFIRASKRGVCR